MKLWPWPTASRSSASSSIPAPRMARALDSPMAQRSASTTLLLPLPLAPRMATSWPASISACACRKRAALQASKPSAAAVAAGARQVQGTLNGLGERCGNASLTSLIPTLLLKEPFRSTLETGITAEALAGLVGARPVGVPPGLVRQVVVALSALRLIEEEALKENTKEVHAIVPVQVASYLLNEKRESVSAIEKRQGGVKAVIVPNDEMQTPHYSVLRVRTGDRDDAAL